MQRVILIGAGALSRDIIEGFGVDRFVGVYVDPDFYVEEFGGLKVYSDWHEVKAIATHYVLGLADIDYRKKVRGVLSEIGLQPADPLIASSAKVASNATIGCGSIIGEFVAVGPSAQIADDVLVMHTCVVAHDTQIRSNVVLCAGVCLGGYVKFGAGCFVGANAVFSPKTDVGADCYIAAGAACLRDVPSGSFVIGNPGRRVARR